MGHPPKRRCVVQARYSDGFTLLEVAIALAILAIAFAAFSTLQARNLTLTAENKGVTQATLAARDILARLQSDLLPLEDGEGEIGDHAAGWLWQLRVEEASVEGLQSVQLFVYREGDEAEQGNAFRFLVTTPRDEKR